MQQTTTVHIQLACAFPVGSKLGPQQVVVGGGSVERNGRILYTAIAKCVRMLVKVRRIQTLK